MKSTYILYETTHGYILKNQLEKYVMNHTKKANSSVPYYLKKVEPDSQYITGLFFDKRKKEYTGKTRNNKRVKVRLGMNVADILIY